MVIEETHYIDIENYFIRIYLLRYYWQSGLWAYVIMKK